MKGVEFPCEAWNDDSGILSSMLSCYNRVLIWYKSATSEIHLADIMVTRKQFSWIGRMEIQVSGPTGCVVWAFNAIGRLPQRLAEPLGLL